MVVRYQIVCDTAILAPYNVIVYAKEIGRPVTDIYCASALMIKRRELRSDTVRK